MIGRIFLVVLLLTGAASAALFATRSGYRVWRAEDTGGVSCTYWLGIGLTEVRHEIAEPDARASFECPLLLRGVVR